MRTPTTISNNTTNSSAANSTTNPSPTDGVNASTTTSTTCTSTHTTITSSSFTGASTMANAGCTCFSTTTTSSTRSFSTTRTTTQQMSTTISMIQGCTDQTWELQCDKYFRLGNAAQDGFAYCGHAGTWTDASGYGEAVVIPTCQVDGGCSVREAIPWGT